MDTESSFKGVCFRECAVFLNQFFFTCSILEHKWYNPQLHFISNKIIYGQLLIKAWPARLMNLQNYAGKTTFFKYINIITIMVARTKLLKESLPCTCKSNYHIQGSIKTLYTRHRV